MTSEWQHSTIEGVITCCDYGLSCGLSTDPTGVPILRMGNLKGGQVSLADLKYAPPEKVGEQHLLRSGDVLLNRTNSLDLVGKVGLFRAKERVTFASYLFRLRTDPTRAVPEWLVQVLHSPAYQAMLRDIATPGVSQANINRDRLRSIPLPVPPLGEQKKIAFILSSVDEVIETSQAVIDQLQVVKKSMMAELLTRGLGERHLRFKQTEIGEVPEEWDILRVNELGDVKLGRMRSPVYTEGALHRYLRVANVHDGRIDTSDVLEMPFEDDQFERFRLVPGDVLLNEGQSLELVGRSAIYRGDPPDCAFQKTLLRFRASERIDTEFAQYVFQWFLYSGRFAEHAVQTTSIAHLTGVRFEGMRMPVPSLVEQRQIAKVLLTVDDRIAVEGSTLRSLGEIKTHLMDVLLTGAVRVKPDEEAA
jgi:type I restriction enzyme S subunit